MEEQNKERRTALVTGGSRGIGRAICLELAAAGMDLVINYAGRVEAAEETARLCEARGARTLCVQADVSQEAECKRLFAAAKDAFGTVDVLVNNAGVTRDGLLLTMPEADFDRVLDTNLKGAFFCMKEAAAMMIRKRRGRIINISSVVGLRGNVGQVNYAASKAGLIGMTKSLAKELASRHITVNAVAPGFIDTEMSGVLPEAVRKKMLETIPLKSMGTPEDVARAAAFFASEGSGYVTGQVLCVDGGMAM